MSFKKLSLPTTRRGATPFDFNAKAQEYNPNRNAPMSKLVAEAMAGSVMLPRGRGPEFRPSSFPSCPILNWMKLYRFKKLGNIESEYYFNMQYYTSVGTTVHEKIQYFMGFTGKMWGHWKCINPKCPEALKAADKRDAIGNMIEEGKPTRRCTTNNICPECAEPMLYIEFTIKFRGTTGHIDGIIKLDNGKWIVMDFKTTSMKKVLKYDFPEKKHLHQLPFYTYVLEKKYGKKYGMKIDEFSLIYIPRDNPRAFVEYREKWNDNWRARCAKRFESESQKWEAVWSDLESETFSEVVANKPCSCPADYKSKMHGFGDCVMQEYCFSPVKLRNALNAWKSIHTSSKIPRLQTFEAVVSLISNAEYKEKKRKVVSL